MASYSWLQMIRVLDGQEPGHPDIPDIPSSPLLSDELRSALADGAAIILGVPVSGHRHAPVSAADWLRIRIDLRSASPYARCGVPYAVAAILPAGTMGEFRDGDGWYDLQIMHPEMVKLKAALARAHHPQASKTHGSEDELTLEAASMLIAVRIGRHPHDARQWLVSQLNAGNLERHYETPVTDWQEQPLVLESNPYGAKLPEPLPHPKHWRVRRGQLLEAIGNHPSQAPWRTRLPPASEWPWTGYDHARVIVGTASSYPPERAREWLVAQSVVSDTCTYVPPIRARFAPHALAELEQRSNREACRAFGPAMILDDFGGDGSDIGNRPGCCEWHRCDLAALLGKGSVNGLTIEQVEWHGEELRTALEQEFSAEPKPKRRNPDSRLTQASAGVPHPASLGPLGSNSLGALAELTAPGPSSVVAKHPPGRKRLYQWDEYGAAFGAWLHQEPRRDSLAPKVHYEALCDIAQRLCDGDVPDRSTAIPYIKRWLRAYRVARIGDDD